MTLLEEQLVNGLTPIVKQHNLIIDELHYLHHGKESVLQIYVEREDLESVDLDSVVSLSEDISKKLDELDLINEEYNLDVSTSGAEKPIKDFSKFPMLIGKYMEVRLKDAISGMNIVTGYLDSVENNNLHLSFKNKTRTINLVTPIENVTKAKLTVKI